MSKSDMWLVHSLCLCLCSWCRSLLHFILPEHEMCCDGLRNYFTSSDPHHDISWWGSHRYQPLPLQASHCVFLVCDVASRSAASLPNVTWRLTELITWMDHQTFQNMSLYRLQFRLQNKHAKTCWSSPKSLMSCRLQCSLKNKHAKTCQDMLETTWITHVMSAAAQLGKQTCQDTVGNHLNQSWNVTWWNAKTYWTTTWFKTELLMYTVLLSKPTQLSHYHKTRSNWFWHDELSWKLSFSYATLPLPLQSLQAVHPWSPVIT